MKATANFTIKAEYARLIQPFMSEEIEARPYLCGFYVEPHPEGGAVIVATNGHVMGVFHDASGRCAKPGIVSLDKAMLKACGQENAVLSITGKRATVRNGIRGETIAKQDGALVDGAFPNWGMIIPRIIPTAVAAPPFDIKLLRKFSGIASWPGNRSEPIKVLTTGPSDPAIVLTERPDFVGVVMPMRAIAADRPPAWFKVLRKTRVKKPAAKLAKVATRKKAA